uniref:Uncharacterized protein C11orf97 homolog isoform X2 n=1 Tax=Geotrypetes seraphini TaxID=260995 RepID=A0A6P8RIX6_GEOSA|nr:uncharacterized protein C11orf97 homolog isoform X2 [Geotrypetes seraphini]
MPVAGDVRMWDAKFLEGQEAASGEQEGGSLQRRGKHFFYIGPSEKIQNLPEEKFIMQRSERHIKSKPAVALEDIWSIKRNISVGHLKPVMQTKNSLLPQPEYYSRYTGIRAQVGLLKDVNHLQSTTGSGFEESFKPLRMGYKMTFTVKKEDLKLKTGITEGKSIKKEEEILMEAYKETVS